MDNELLKFEIFTRKVSQLLLQKVRSKEIDLTTQEINKTIMGDNIDKNGNSTYLINKDIKDKLPESILKEIHSYWLQNL